MFFPCILFIIIIVYIFYINFTLEMLRWSCGRLYAEAAGGGEMVWSMSVFPATRFPPASATAKRLLLQGMLGNPDWEEPNVSHMGGGHKKNHLRVPEVN